MPDPVESPGALPAAGQLGSRARQARTALLCGLFVFLALQIGTAVLTDRASLRDPIYFGRLQRLARQTRNEHEKPLTVVMLGSSRTRSGLRAGNLHQILSESLGQPVGVANFGQSGCGSMTHLLTWNRLVHDGVRPDLVLVEVMPAFCSQNTSLADITEQKLPLGRVRRCDLPFIERYFADVRPELRHEWQASWANPLYTQRLNLVNWVAPDLLPMGYRTLDLTLPEDRSTTSASPLDQPRGGIMGAKNHYYDALQQFRLGGKECDYLRELLTQIRREGVPVALVLMPEGPEYRSWYPPQAFAEFHGWLEGLSREYEIPLIDLREWDNEDDFSDSHHLTQAGAVKFTERLGREYLVPLLKQRRATR